MFDLCAFILMLILHTQAKSRGECDEPILLYEDLHCTPLFDSLNDRCPSHYNCSHIEQRAQLNKEECYFHGKTYSPGDRINDDETYRYCYVGCFCDKKHFGNMGFVCAVLDCFTPITHPLNLECHDKYELDKCCSVGQICEPNNITCDLGSKSYKEGQRFDAPSPKCAKCVCQAGFQGEYEPPFCQRISCLQEISYHKEINSFCAPSYISKKDCCPFIWICPDGKDKIIFANLPPKNPDLNCKFGEHTLNIGDSFSRTAGSKGRLRCECRIPPYLTCIQNYDYPI